MTLEKQLISSLIPTAILELFEVQKIENTDSFLILVLIKKQYSIFKIICPAPIMEKNLPYTKHTYKIVQDAK
jgi:hypothetical protein